MEKIWLKPYPRGVPATIDVNEYASVRDVFDASVRKYAARKAYTCMGKSLTFAELDVLSAAGSVCQQLSRSGEPRQLFCGIGRCTDCVMVVEGQPNVRTCVTAVRDGMHVDVQ